MINAELFIKNIANLIDIILKHWKIHISNPHVFKERDEGNKSHGEQN